MTPSTLSFAWMLNPDAAMAPRAEADEMKIIQRRVAQLWGIFSISGGRCFCVSALNSLTAADVYQILTEVLPTPPDIAAKYQQNHSAMTLGPHIS
jgi:hypothetical protein